MALDNITIYWTMKKQPAAIVKTQKGAKLVKILLL